MKFLFAVLSTVMLAGCGSAAHQTAAESAPTAVTQAPAAMLPTPEAGAAPAVAPVVVAPPVELPDAMAVSLGVFAPGRYTVHLHSICSGGQQYHLTTVTNALTVDHSGLGSVALPATDFGRGWCLVVYSDPGATRVLGYRPV